MLPVTSITGTGIRARTALPEKTGRIKLRVENLQGATCEIDYTRISKHKKL